MEEVKKEMLRGCIVGKLNNDPKFKGLVPITATNMGGNYDSNANQLKKLSELGMLIAIELPQTTDPKTTRPVYFKTSEVKKPRAHVYEEDGRTNFVVVIDPKGTFAKMNVPSDCEVTLDKKIIGFVNHSTYEEYRNYGEVTLDKNLMDS